MTVLLVDDNRLVINALKLRIDWEALGVSEVLTAQNITKAQQIFSEVKVDIMVCDIEMPQGSGLELLAWMRDEGYTSRTIFLTSYADFNYAQKAIELQSFDYFLKPIAFDKLTAILQKAIAKEREEQKQAVAIQQLLNSTAEQNHSAEQGAEEFVAHEKNTGVVFQVKEYVTKNLDCNLSRNSLAEQFYLNPDYLARIFAKHEGVSLGNYIMQTRIEKAKMLLKSTELSVNAIAMQVGYSNYSHFSRIFRECCGCSPNEYRKGGSSLPEKTPET